MNTKEIFDADKEDVIIYEKLGDEVLREIEDGIPGSYTYELYYMYSLNESEQIELYIGYVEKRKNELILDTRSELM